MSEQKGGTKVGGMKRQNKNERKNRKQKKKINKND